MKRRSEGLSRRSAIAAMTAGGAAILAPRAARAQAVNWSAGTQAPRRPLPAGTVDCHHHIYDARYPTDPKATLRPADALIEDYRQLQKRLGIARHVIVQPSTYGLDNRCVLDALETFGPSARAVVVINNELDDDELKRMDGLGVRGVRFNLNFPAGAPIEIMAPLARRIAPLGWHVQIVAKPATVVEQADLLGSLPTPVVFDHMGQLSGPGIAHPAFGIIAKLLEAEKAWVKLSGAYTFSEIGPPTYADAGTVARRYAGIAPDRLIWGSDWPHPTAAENAKPDDSLLVDLIGEWIGSDANRTKLFVDNPVKLYGF